MPGITLLGSKSKTTFLAPEEDKVTVELTANEAIKKGQPIKLTADGKAAVWAKADTEAALIGYAFGDAAAGELTTIWSRGYAVIFGISKAAQNAGPAVYDSYDSATDISGASGYSVYDTAAPAAVNGWVLDQSTGANELIRILLKD